VEIHLFEVGAYNSIMYMYIYICLYIQDVSEGIVNILGGGSMDYSE